MKKQTKSGRFGLKFFIIWGSVGLALCLLMLGAFVVYLASNLPEVGEISKNIVVESTKIYDRTGNVLLYELHGDQNRTTIKSEDIPAVVKEALVSIEDENFYKNPAFDWRGILRAIAVNIINRKALQGGSTITQQLAKNLFLTPERTPIRKLKELILASRLEQEYTKDQIITFYLNAVPYGSNIYGIEAASHAYFGVEAKNLTLGQAAILAAMVKATTYYSPWGYHLEELFNRKNLVLQKMFDLGYITENQMTLAKKNNPVILPQSAGDIKAPHFVMYVTDYLNKKYGEDFVRTAGLKVTTTLDLDMQISAEKVIASGVKRNTDLYGGKNAALVALDPKTGQVLSLVGSANYFDQANEGNFNVATQGLRQPGSAFKPFAYMTAFQKGFTPDTVIWDTPTEFDTTGNPTKSYKPENYDGSFVGPILMKDALAGSRNIPAVKTLYLAGVNDTISTAEKFGITTLSDRSRFGLSLVLGGGEVKLIDLASAYSVFATEGIKHETTPILKVVDKNGSTLEEYQDKSEQVVEPQYPRLINDVLSDPELRSKLFSSSLPLTKVPGYQIALKTGTTNDYVDAWAMGYTPTIVVGVWAGNNHREPLTSRGGSVLAAVPIWHDFIVKVISKFSNETFTKPDPLSPDNPVLRGELVPGDQHDILYYLGRQNDPQFKNWEDGVSEWLKTNAVDFSKFTPQPKSALLENSSSNNISDSVVVINSPSNGTVINNQNVNVIATIKSQNPIKKIEVYWNDKLIDTREVDGALSEFVYNSFISVPEINTQNMLSVLAIDRNNKTSRSDAILFR